jgi:hypothetical protein
MSSVIPSSWWRRVRALLSLLVRPRVRHPGPPMPWADMKPIDFQGEDGSLTERDLRLMK